MADTIAALRRDIGRDLEVVAKNLETKYSIGVPCFSGSYGDVGVQLEELSKKVTDKLGLAEGIITSNCLTTLGETEKNLKKELHEVKECRDLIDKLCLIETNLVNLGADSSNVMTNANLVAECLDYLNDLTSDENASVLTDKIKKLLKQEVNDYATSLRCSLGEEFKKLVSFPQCNTKGVKIMNISNENSSNTSANLTAMQILSYLEPKLTKWTNDIVQHFCRAAIESRDGYDIFDCDIIKPGVCSFKVRSKAKGTLRDFNVDGVIKSLTQFFTNLAGSLKDIDVNGEMLTRCIGKGIEESLMDMIVKDFLSVAIPFCDQKDPRFDEAMQTVEIFRETLIELGFWNDRVPKFHVYAESSETVFIDRRCLSILTQAKKLITQPYIDLKEVGGVDEFQEETITDFVAAFGQPPPSLENCDQTYPKLMQLLKCKISKSAEQFVMLLERTLTDAVETDNEQLCARLALTASNMLQLYLIIAPKHHCSTISSVPESAAVFYNNAYFICHRILMLPFGILKNIKKDSAKYDHFRPIGIKSIWGLREIAADSLEQMLAQCRRQLSTILAEREVFNNLHDYDRLKDCHRTIDSALMLLKSVAEVWREVMSEAVFCKALGNVVGFFLNDICAIFLDLEDIRSTDAETAASILQNILEQLENIFRIRGTVCITMVCESPYFRTKEIIFFLNGSLKGVADRWCDGKGPLAQWLTPNEVRSLVKAVFMNTEQRKKLLESIC
ncbi:unnamed protein product [Auanema sp. JU1783]|nr:unnamed protein product [Auanema sp. JU1783]